VKDLTSSDKSIREQLAHARAAQRKWRDMKISTGRAMGSPGRQRDIRDRRRLETAKRVEELEELLRLERKQREEEQRGERDRKEREQYEERNRRDSMAGTQYTTESMSTESHAIRVHRESSDFERARPVRQRPERMARQPFQQPDLQGIDAQNRDMALLDLRRQPRFQAHLERNFVFDPGNHQNLPSYRARQQPHYSIQPIVQPHIGAYQLQAVHHEEIATLRPRYRDIETFERPVDTYDRARKFNRESIRKRPLDGRAMQYVSIGPWIRLRFLKSTVHITRKGTPPYKAYLILAKHILKQLEFAKAPRLIIPILQNKKRTTIQTLASTERLHHITEADLAKVCQVGLQKKSRHVIYRQKNRGGPLFTFAKNNEVLY